MPTRRLFQAKENRGKNIHDMRDSFQRTVTAVAKFDGPAPQSEQWKDFGIYSPGADAVYVSTN